MRLCELLSPSRIIIPLQGRDKPSIMRELISSWADPEMVTVLTAEVLKREQKMTTGIGLSVAIPHAYSDLIDCLKLAVGIVPGGIDFQSIDYKPVHLVFLDIVPQAHLNQHREYLQYLSGILYREDRRELLSHAINAADFLESLAMIEEGIHG